VHPEPGGDVKEPAPGRRPPRRPESAEAPPLQRPVEVGDAAERAEALLSPEPHLVRSAAAPGGVRAVTVVPEQEVAAEPVDLAGAVEQPDGAADLLLEGREDTLDAAVGPGVSGAGAAVPEGETFEGRGERGSGEGRAVIGQHARWRTVRGDSALENGNDGSASRPRHALERHKAAAVVVDDAHEPDEEDAEYPDPRQVHCPQLEPAAHPDAAATLPPLLAQLNDELGPAGKDSAERLSRGLDAQHALRESRELPAAELWLLDVEAHHLLLDVGGRAVPRAPVVGEVLRHQQTAGAEPAPPELAHGAAQSPHRTDDRTLVLVDGDREVEEQADDGDACGTVAGEEQSHAEILAYATNALLGGDHPGPQIRIGGLRLNPVFGARVVGRGTASREGVREISAEYDGIAADPLNAFNQMLTRSRSGGGLPALNTTFAYDENGSTLSESTVSPAATTTYSWDRDNRLRIATPPAPATPTSYSYDAHGWRVQRADATGTTRYLLDGKRLLAELDAASATVTRYLNYPKQLNELISFERAGTTYHPLIDALGSWYAVTDSSGAMVRRFDFEVYGTRTDLGGTGPALDVGFTGQRHDANGLMGTGVRTYMPPTGVWLEPDRAGMIDGPNLYGYVRNRPTIFVDPTGLAPSLGDDTEDVEWRIQMHRVTFDRWYDESPRVWGWAASLANAFASGFAEVFRRAERASIEFSTSGMFSAHQHPDELVVLLPPPEGSMGDTGCGGYTNSLIRYFDQLHATHPETGRNVVVRPDDVTAPFAGTVHTVAGVEAFAGNMTWSHKVAFDPWYRIGPFLGAPFWTMSEWYLWYGPPYGP